MAYLIGDSNFNKPKHLNYSLFGLIRWLAAVILGFYNLDAIEEEVNV